jgi:hypothetical protein
MLLTILQISHMSRVKIKIYPTVIFKPYPNLFPELGVLVNLIFCVLRI